MASIPAVFLDRDGVLNRTLVSDGTPHPPSSCEQVEILPGVREALTELATERLQLIVVTNQPDVARGTQTREVVEAINALLMAELPLTRVYTCFHDTPDNCACRKPKPGLLHEAAAAYNIDLRRKLEQGSEPRLIQTVRGVGYVLDGWQESVGLDSRSRAVCGARASLPVVSPKDARGSGLIPLAT